MPDSLTTHFSLIKPQDGASEDTWGVKLNGDLDVVDEVLHQLVTDANFALADGSANAIEIAPEPAHTAYVAGTRFLVKCAHNNTGAVTLAVNGMAAKTCKLNDGSALTAGVLKAGGVYAFVYDGADMRLAERAAAQAAELLAGTDNAKVTTALALAGLNSTVSGSYVVKLPGGYMIQAGRTAGGATAGAVTFPVAFSEAPIVTLTTRSTGAATASGTSGVAGEVGIVQLNGDPSATGFSFYAGTEGEVNDVFNAAGGRKIDWQAIGRVAVS